MGREPESARQRVGTKKKHTAWHGMALLGLAFEASVEYNIATNDGTFVLAPL